MKKAILISSSFLPRLNGITYATISHIKLLKELNFDVTLITNVEVPISELNKYNLEDLTIIQFSIDGSGLFWNPLIGSINDVVKFINKINPSFVFVEGWYNWGIQVVLNIKFRCKIIIFSHGSAEIRVSDFLSLIKRIGYFIYDFLNQKKIYNKVDAVVFLSFFEDNNRFRDFSIAKSYFKKYFVLPNVNFESIFVDPVVYIKKSTLGFNVAIVGDMSTNKNQMYLLKIISQLNSNINFHIFYPNDNKYSLAFKSDSNYLNFKNRFIFYKGLDREQINMFTKFNIDLLLILSNTEAQPIVLIDALHQNIPFLSTDVGCVQEFRGGLTCRLNEVDMYLNKFVNDNYFYEFHKSEITSYLSNLEVDKYKFSSFLDNV